MLLTPFRFRSKKSLPRMDSGKAPKRQSSVEGGTLLLGNRREDSAGGSTLRVSGGGTGSAPLAVRIAEEVSPIRVGTCRQKGQQRWHGLPFSS